MIHSFPVFFFLCVVFRVAGTHQAANWAKESWRSGGELYWNSWMHLDDRTSAALVWFLYTSANMHPPPPSPAHLTVLVIPPWADWIRRHLSPSEVTQFTWHKETLISCQVLFFCFKYLFCRCSCMWASSHHSFFKFKCIVATMPEIDFLSLHTSAGNLIGSK